jgi:MYXO-CTERM domain-containing protein
MRVAPTFAVQSLSLRRLRNLTPQVYFGALLVTISAVLGACSLRDEGGRAHDRERAGMGSAIQSEGERTQLRTAQASCSSSGEPMTGAVEQAAGVVALIALVLGLRRRFGRRDDANVTDLKDGARPRERFYSIP